MKVEPEIMKISVIIVTKDRKNELVTTIEGFKKQTYKNYEIIIVDNASTDGTREFIPAEYPEIKYLWLPDNFDIRSINIGVEMSDGDIIWRTDSDSNPETPDEFQKVIDIFQKHEDIDIISMEDVEVRQNYAIWNWYPLPHSKDNIPEKGYKANAFAGTGAAIRRKVFDKIGGFWEFGFEEIDFCTRAIVNDFSVRYFPNIRVLHYSTPVERQSDERWIRISNQFVRYTWKYLPFRIAFGRFIIIYISQMIQVIPSRLRFITFCEGALSMLSTMLRTIRAERQVVPKDKLKDVTLGVSLAKVQFNYFKSKIVRKFFR